MERALVEVIGAGVVALPDDVKTWLECTLLFHQSDWAEVHRAAKSGLDYLQQVHRNAQKRSETPVAIGTLTRSRDDVAASAADPEFRIRPWVG